MECPEGKHIAAFKEGRFLVRRIRTVPAGDRLENFDDDETVEQGFRAENAYLAGLGGIGKHAISIKTRHQRNQGVGGADVGNVIPPGDLTLAVLEDGSAAAIGCEEMRRLWRRRSATIWSPPCACGTGWSRFPSGRAKYWKAAFCPGGRRSVSPG